MEDNVKSTIVDDGYYEKGWVYSLIKMSDGAKKCFYVKAGMLPKYDTAKPNDIATCRNFRTRLSSNDFLEEYNCGFFASGLQKCRSGTNGKEITAACPDANLYRNVTTNKPSPWNINGRHTAEFSEPVYKKDGAERSKVSYRAQLILGVGATKAIVVRDTERGESWAFMDTNCVASSDRMGGVPTR